MASYDDSDALLAAFAGVETLFMVSAEENRDRVAQHFRCVDAAAARGVQRIVYTSFLGAAADSTFTLGRDHWATEERIRASGMAWTMLRDNFYADFVPDDGRVRTARSVGRPATGARHWSLATTSPTLLRGCCSRSVSTTGGRTLSRGRKPCPSTRSRLCCRLPSGR